MRIREDQSDEVIVFTPIWLRRSWYQPFQMAYEIPFLLPQMDLSQHLPNKSVLYHTDQFEIVSVEAEQHALQDKSISGIAIRTSLNAACDTIQIVYFGR